MKRRLWDSRTKVKIVLEGLSGRAVADLCNEHQIGQHQYYRWRDQFLGEAHRVFESKKNGSEVEKLRQKTARLQQIIGALTVELKKSEDELL
jgi:transposase-like protein